MSSNMREQFEKLPEIAEGLKHCTYNESTNDYHANVAHDNEWEWNTQFVNGAWYTYQDQQNKIDKAINEARDWHTLTGNALGLKIQELLK